MRFTVCLLVAGCAHVELVCTPGVVDDDACVASAEPYVVQDLSCGDYKDYGAQVLDPFEEEVTCAESAGSACCVCAVEVPGTCTGGTND